MDGRAVPDDQHRARDHAQEVAQELCGGYGVKGVLAYLGVELSLRADGGDHGKVVACAPLAQDRRLAAWRVGTHDRRQRVEAALVYEKEALA